MPIEKVTNKGDEKELVFFKTPSMCSYLICLYIGTFSSISGKTENGTFVEFFTTKGESELLRNYLNTALFAMNWMESKFGVKYELSHLQLASIYGFGGGMENYGLITLMDCTEENDSVFRELIVIHEIVHQWFGDLVSIKFWDSLWLNEGFAQFIEYLILNDYKPESKPFDIFVQKEAFNCLKFYKQGVLVPNENEIDFVRLFNSLIYSKGAFVVKMFYDLVGMNNFCAVCGNYLNTYKN